MWHALRNLRKAVFGSGKAYEHLKVISKDSDGQAMRTQVMSLLCQMAKTEEKQDFLIAEQMIHQLLVERSPRFLQHLERHYLNRREQWSRAWRVVPDGFSAINTSMHIEASHRVIKHVYMGGNANRRLDSLIHVLLRYARDQEISLEMNAQRQKYSKVETEASTKHREKARLYFENQSMIVPETDIENTLWRVKSADPKYPHKTYEVSDPRNLPLQVRLLRTICICMTSPPCRAILSKAALGVHADRFADKDRPSCGVCDCRYSCNCDARRFNSSRACKHMHAVHALYFALPAALGKEPTIWLTGLAGDDEIVEGEQVGHVHD